MADLLIVLPEHSLDAAIIERAKRNLVNRFSATNIAFGSVSDDADVIVYFEGVVIPDRPWRPEQRIYRYLWSVFSWGGRGALRKVHPTTYTKEEYPEIDRHIFNRLGHHQHGFVYFPYGTLYHDAEMGGINEFGFRAQFDPDALINRPAHHKLIVIFGGSAAFSVHCNEFEMFSARLQALLDERDWKIAPKPIFTVLNFGMHDYVMFQEMITYLLFAQKLRPDVVISHSGHNELWYGLRNDHHFVGQHGIVYQAHHEKWAELIHAWPHEHASNELPLELNMPHVVLKAALERIRQVRDVVQASGGAFIWGLQPLLEGKGALHPVEQSYLDSFESVFAQLPRRRKFYSYILRLMNALSAAAPDVRDLRVVDVHGAFGSFGADRELLWDHVHTSPQGDQEIASLYCGAVARILEGDR